MRGGVIVAIRDEAERSKGQSRMKAPGAHTGLVQKGAVAEDPKRAAEIKRESAYRVLASLKKEWEIESGKVGVLDERLEELKREADEKRKILMMLGVLKKREALRLVRIGSGEDGGIGILIKDLR